MTDEKTKNKINIFMKNGKILPSQFTTDDGHISVISVAFFGLTLAVI